MPATMLTEQDVSTQPLNGKLIAVFGYGSQAHAHALNLKDGGFEVIIALREGSQSRAQAEAAGFRVVGLAEATQQADILSLLIPDEAQPAVYGQYIAPYLKSGQALIFAHGFNIHFGYIAPPKNIDVLLLAPKGPGPMLRRSYVAGSGLAGIFAIHQDATGHARERVLAYAGGIGCMRVGVIKTTFKEECETDLFGEQAVLCGGVSYLIQAGFETLLEAGYQPEIAYFETVHEVKLIVDLIHERGLAAMNEKISNTAEYGGYVTGPRLMTEQTKASMREVLAEIQSGHFAERFIQDYQTGFPTVHTERQRTQRLSLEKAGEMVRSKLPYLNHLNQPE